MKFEIAPAVFVLPVLLHIFPGVYSRLETHVPIPNTIDKEPSDDGTAHQSVGE